MKWTLLLAFTLAVTAGCEKSNVVKDDAKLHASADPETKNVLVGTWRLIEYFQDRGDGTGHWVAPQALDEITFSASGEVKVSETSPLANRGFDRYRIVGANRVELYSSSSENKEVFYFNRESEVYLIFHPLCRENCSRRYKLVN